MILLYSIIWVNLKLKERNFVIIPFAETLGQWEKDAILFTDKLSEMLNWVSGEARSKKNFQEKHKFSLTTSERSDYNGVVSHRGQI